MTLAAAHYSEPRPDQNVRDHLSGLIDEFIAGRGPSFGRKKGPQVRVLAASAASPLVMAIIPFIPKLDTLGLDLRVLLAERGMNDSRDVLIGALGRLRADGQMSGDVLRQVAGKAAAQVNESLVLGEYAAWIGAPMPDRWAIQTDQGQTVYRPSAVHLAAMGFEAIRLGSDPWPVESELAQPCRRAETGTEARAAPGRGTGPAAGRRTCRGRSGRRQRCRSCTALRAFPRRGVRRRRQRNCATASLTYHLKRLAARRSLPSLALV